MKENKGVTIDAEVAKGIAGLLNQLPLDYANSRIRNVLLDHMFERMQEAGVIPTQEETNGL